MSFYSAEPTPRTSWRQAVLMGVNSRTYKFALGTALLDLAKQGHDDVPLTVLAERYSWSLLTRAGNYPQAPATVALRDNDFLAILARERTESLTAGHPTEELVAAAEKSMPGMVMQKFHNLRGIGEVAHSFYNLHGPTRNRIVHLTPELHRVAAADDVLSHELDSRWTIVEASFDSRIGRTLIDSGVQIDEQGQDIVIPARRTTLTSVRGAIAGFQHGRCFYCHQEFEHLHADIHVDHFFPFSWMNTGSWHGPDLNHVWNLVLACGPCNLTKSNRQPTTHEVGQLLDRNDAIAESPHPLRRTLEITMQAAGTSPDVRARKRHDFVAAVWNHMTERSATTPSIAVQ
ncbi:HNH endonuclease [Rhodococcus triatomae]